MQAGGYRFDSDTIHQHSGSAEFESRSEYEDDGDYMTPYKDMKPADEEDFRSTRIVVAIVILSFVVVILRDLV